MEKQKCKWNEDGFCVNGDCPYVADFCPVEEDDSVCMYNGDKKFISDWQTDIHRNARKHGWWEKPPTAGELLMLVTSEVAEAFEEVRKGKAMTETYYSEGGKMEGVPSELADVVIRVMDICEYYGIDLEKVIAEKHEFNKTRPYKHGGKVL